MNRTAFPAIGLLLLVAGNVIAAEPPPPPPSDPVGSQLFPPELILQQREKIGLKDEQFQAIHAEIERVQPAFASRQQALESANKALADVVGQARVDEAQAAEALKKVLDAEREIKLLHLTVLIRIKNQLTQEQQTALAKLRKESPPADPDPDPRQVSARLKAKLERVEAGVKKRVQAGDLPVDVVDMMQQFPQLMQQGKTTAAEALLDKALKLLGADSPPDPESGTKSPESKREDPQTSSEPRGSSPRDPGAQPRPPRSFAALHAEVSALHVKDVPWRAIPWETCLLDGLRRSRDEHKPLMRTSDAAPCRRWPAVSRRWLRGWRKRLAKRSPTRSRPFPNCCGSWT